MVSGFESASLVMRYYPGKDPDAVVHTEGGKPPTLFFGGSYLSYLKPYQVTIGEHVLDEYLFTGRFHGGGLALGGTLGGGINFLFIDLGAQLGLGQVRLTEDMTLNELAPEDWMIGYFRGNATFRYKWAPFDFKPTLLIIPEGTISGATFFFFETDRQEGEPATTPSINWDVLYSVKLTLVLTL